MKKFLAEFIKRLTSRKFLLTVAACITFYLNKQYTELAITVAGYLGVEGLGDAAERYATPKATAAADDLQNTKIQLLGADALPDTGVDKTQFVAGGSSGQ